MNRYLLYNPLCINLVLALAKAEAQEWQSKIVRNNENDKLEIFNDSAGNKYSDFNYLKVVGNTQIKIS